MKTMARRSGSVNSVVLLTFLLPLLLALWAAYLPDTANGAGQSQDTFSQDSSAETTLFPQLQSLQIPTWPTQPVMDRQTALFSPALTRQSWNAPPQINNKFSFNNPILDTSWRKPGEDLIFPVAEIGRGLGVALIPQARVPYVPASFGAIQARWDGAFAALGMGLNAITLGKTLVNYGDFTFKQMQQWNRLPQGTVITCPSMDFRTGNSLPDGLHNLVNVWGKDFIHGIVRPTYFTRDIAGPVNDVSFDGVTRTVTAGFARETEVMQMSTTPSERALLKLYPMNYFDAGATTIHRTREFSGTIVTTVNLPPDQQPLGSPWSLGNNIQFPPVRAENIGLTPDAFTRKMLYLPPSSSVGSDFAFQQPYTPSIQSSWQSSQSTFTTPSTSFSTLPQSATMPMESGYSMGSTHGSQIGTSIGQGW